MAANQYLRNIKFMCVLTDPYLYRVATLQNKY